MEISKSLGAVPQKNGEELTRSAQGRQRIENAQNRITQRLVDHSIGMDSESGNGANSPTVPTMPGKSDGPMGNSRTGPYDRPDGPIVRQPMPWDNEPTLASSPPGSSGSHDSHGGE